MTAPADLPPGEHAARRARLAAAMAADGLDWLLAIHPASIHWLTGSEAKSYQAFQCCLVGPHERPPVVLAREGERAELTLETRGIEVRAWGTPDAPDPVDALLALADELGVPDARAIGIEVPAYYLHPHHLDRLRAALGARLVEASDLVHDLRLVKSAAEIALVREAARIADLSVEALREALAPGRTELAVAADVIGAIMHAGGDQPAVPPNFVSGPRAAYSHGAATARRLCRGDAGNAEYGVPFRRYVASIGRQFSIGPPSPRTARLADVAREAADAAIAAIADGVPATVPFEAAARVIDRAGLGAGRVHTCGYALAPAFPPATGDRLQLVPGNGYTLRAGMVLSVCPPIFLAEERAGARIVDTVLVTADGAERLSCAPREIIVCPA